MRKYLDQVNFLRSICKRSQTNSLLSIIKYYQYRMRWKINLLAHPMAHIQGLENITTTGLLNVGCGEYFGITTPSDGTSLNVAGKLIIEGDFVLGRGCRIDIGRNGRMIVGPDSFVSPFTLFTVMNSLTLGSGSTISWQ